ncbi:MAG TPA: hypothetical protein VM890_09375 [Longimicrobium sp.]|nr:hypothetical protein [Longimicrobium sp.]
MSPATLSPPPVTEARSPRAAPPRLPQPVPLRRVRTVGGGLRLTRSAVLVSLALHAVLGVLLVLGIDQVKERGDQRAAARSDAERVSYLDVGQWPTSGASSSGAAAGTGALTAAQAVTAAAIDSAIARQSGLDRFPDRVPTRLLAAPGGAAPRPGVPGAAPGARPGTGAPAPGGNGNAIEGDVAGGRFGPGYGDRRLVVTPQAVPEREKTEHERYMAHLNSRLGAINDSVADEAAHQRRLRNWLVKDRSGREWGIGEGGVPVIAGRRIPVPLSPPIYRGRDREDAERTAGRQRTEIERQAEDVDRDRSFRERTRATRARVDAERRRRREAAGDTTRTSP